MADDAMLQPRTVSPSMVLHRSQYGELHIIACVALCDITTYLCTLRESNVHLRAGLMYPPHGRPQNATADSLALGKPSSSLPSTQFDTSTFLKHDDTQAWATNHHLQIPVCSSPPSLFSMPSFQPLTQKPPYSLALRQLSLLPNCLLDSHPPRHKHHDAAIGPRSPLAALLPHLSA